MAKKIVKKKKVRVFRLLLILVVLGLLFFAGYLYLNTKIKNLIVTGNHYLTDDDILVEAQVEDYPSFYFTFSSKIKKRLLKNPLVKEVEVSKSFYHILHIQVEDNIILVHPTHHLHGAHVSAGEIRAGACLMLAGLMADGETIISNAGNILRGYDRIEQKLRQLGAEVSVIDV